VQYRTYEASIGAARMAGEKNACDGSVPMSGEALAWLQNTGVLQPPPGADAENGAPCLAP
jgi:hypothetical protein